jgi:hypothetical protein
MISWMNGDLTIRRIVELEPAAPRDKQQPATAFDHDGDFAERPILVMGRVPALQPPGA